MSEGVLHGGRGLIERVCSMVIKFEWVMVALTGGIVLPFLLLGGILEMMVAQVPEGARACATMQRRGIERCRRATGLQRRRVIGERELGVVKATRHDQVLMSRKYGRLGHATLIQQRGLEITRTWEVFIGRVLTRSAIGPRIWMLRMCRIFFRIRVGIRMEEAVLRNGDGLRQCGKRTMVKARRRFVKERIHWALVCICSNRKAIIIIGLFCCVRRGGEIEGEVGAAEEEVGGDEVCGRLLL